MTNPVIELLDECSLNYLPSGRDYVIRCLNPEHEDKNPSMRIDQITGVFRCVSCGFSGNIFTYFNKPYSAIEMRKYKLKEKISKKLAENTGLEIPKNSLPFNEEWRGIRPETFKHFEAFTTSMKELQSRVVFPLRNIRGSITAFVGRSTISDGKEKYKNYPTKVLLPLYPTSVKPLYGRVMLVEGIFDMLNLYDKGLTNVIVNFGVQPLTIEKLKLLKVLGVKSIDIFFDPDKAGELGSDKVKKLCEQEGLETRVVSYGDNDPGDLTFEQIKNLREKLYG